jgi:hypothetical protein
MHNLAPVQTTTIQYILPASVTNIVFGDMESTFNVLS